MLCDSTETALRIDSQWSCRQIRQSVRAAESLSKSESFIEHFIS